LQLYPETEKATVVQGIRDYAETWRHQIVAGFRKLRHVEEVDCFGPKLQGELSSQPPRTFERGVHVGNLASSKGIPSEVTSPVGRLHEPKGGSRQKYLRIVWIPDGATQHGGIQKIHAVTALAVDVAEPWPVGPRFHAEGSAILEQNDTGKSPSAMTLHHPARVPDAGSSYDPCTSMACGW